MKELLALLAFATLAAALHGEQREQLQEDYGYVEVRPGAHMFYVMYHVDQPGDYTDYPLIMWLQGGPGASSVGFGNFGEMGPYDINGNAREYAWTKKANVMYVDNPVGTGYSYVENNDLYATDNAMIAADLVTLVKAAFTAHPQMQVMPFYVFAESYGGKMTVDFALEFVKAIKNGEVVSDFRGVALGDSWVSAMDSVNTWGSFLYHMGIVNQHGQERIDEAAAQAQADVDAGRWSDATDSWSYTEGVVEMYGNYVNFYNVLAENDIYSRKTYNESDLSFMSSPVRKLYERHVIGQTRDALGDFMNGDQATHWNIPSGVTWGGQSGYVFDALAGDFMKPAVDSVVRLLTETDLHVVVFTGNLDLICDTPGTYRWVESMEWPDKPAFKAAHNEPIYLSSYESTAATVQKAGKFSLYTLLRSGHMISIDVPEMAFKMVEMIFDSTKKLPSDQQAHQEETVKEKTVKQETKPAVNQKTPNEPNPEHLPEANGKSPKKTNTLKEVKEQALKEEIKKEAAAVRQKEQEESQEDSEETSQEEHKDEKVPEKQEDAKEEKMHPEEETKEKQKKEIKNKQEMTSKRDEVKQKEVPKQEEIKLEEVKQEEEHQEETQKQEKSTKGKEQKQEKSFKGKKQKEEKSQEGKEQNQEKSPEEKKQKQEKSPEESQQKQENSPEGKKQKKEKKPKEKKQKQEESLELEEQKKDDNAQQKTEQEKSLEQKNEKQETSSKQKDMKYEKKQGKNYKQDYKKQEKSPKYDKRNQEKASKQKKYEEKVARPDKYKQDKKGKYEQNKQKYNKQKNYKQDNRQKDNNREDYRKGKK